MYDSTVFSWGTSRVSCYPLLRKALYKAMPETLPLSSSGPFVLLATSCHGYQWLLLCGHLVGPAGWPRSTPLVSTVLRARLQVVLGPLTQGSTF